MAGLRSTPVTMAMVYLALSSSSAQHTAPGLSSFVAPPGFPTSVFSSYYVPPAATQQPQPAIYDPILNLTFPLNLTDPKTIPDQSTDPIFYPEPVLNLSSREVDQLVDAVIANVSTIIEGNNTASDCSKCLDALSVAKQLALYAPSTAPKAMVKLCKKYGLHSHSTCKEDFEATTFGAIWTQILRFADLAGSDGRYICYSINKFCPVYTTAPLDTSILFPKPKPANATSPKASGKRVKVLHMSDFHLDPRYSVASEANCSSSMCCRTNVHNTDLRGSDQISFPAPLYGAFQCDSPYDLGLAALEAVGPLTGTNEKNPLAWTVYTGDLVSHDHQTQLSRAYTEYAETSLFDVFRKYITGPIFAALGNHDSNPEAIDAPHNLPGPLGQQQSWNFDHVAGLWLHEGWIGEAEAAQARTHYGAYSMRNHYGLRIITFNTDFWYKANYLNFINTTDPDNSGMFKFMIDELQAAEDAGERVWIVGHVLSGWDGTNPIPNPTDLFYQIVERYSPHVIANIFFGHTHEDQLMIYYANNGTLQNAENALTTGWIGPSVTPLTNLNSGFRLYEVDTGSFDIVDAWTFVADVSSFSDLGDTVGPTFSLEYSTRDTYGPAAGWPDDAPLNATFWHRVTEAMETNTTLVSVFNTLQGKSSIMSPNCTTEACAKAKICYMRSGSVALGSQCPQGYGSVQSAFSPSS